MAFTYLRFHAALKYQQVDRGSLPYQSWGQPVTAYYALTDCVVMAFVGGYTIFLPGKWDISNFLLSYTTIALFPAVFVVWKVVNKTNWRQPGDFDLREGHEDINLHEKYFVEHRAW